MSKKYGQIGDGVFRRASRLFRLGKRLYGKQVPEVMQALPPCVGLGFLVDPRCFQDRHEALRYGAMCQMLTWKPAWKKESHFLCLKVSLRVGPSGWFTVDLPSVLRQGAITPWRRTYIFSHYFSRYKFELRLPFSRQRRSLEISSALHRSFSARLTVERDSRSSAEIVRIPGQHLPSLSAWSFRYIYTALARWFRSD